MMQSVIVIGLTVAVLAAALHVLIFWMESVAWEGALARRTFGGTPEEARPHAFYAYNQGFYNLFLALEVFLGVFLWAAGGSGPPPGRGPLSCCSAPAPCSPPLSCWP